MIEKLKELEELDEQRNKIATLFFNKITAFSIALIGLLIGLKPNPIPIPDAKLFFFLSILFLALCTLFSLFAQRYELYVFEWKDSILRKEIVDELDQAIKSVHPNGVNNGVKGWRGKPIFYKACEFLTYTCLIASISTLVYYVYLLEFS